MSLAFALSDQSADYVFGVCDQRSVLSGERIGTGNQRSTKRTINQRNHQTAALTKLAFVLSDQSID